MKTGAVVKMKSTASTVRIVVAAVAVPRGTSRARR